MKKNLSLPILLAVTITSYAPGLLLAQSHQAAASDDCPCGLPASTTKPKIHSQPSTGSVLVANHYSGAFLVHDTAAPAQPFVPATKKPSPDVPFARKTIENKNSTVPAREPYVARQTKSMPLPARPPADELATAAGSSAPSILEPDPTMGSRVLHVVVGHSLFFRVPGAELRNVYVSNPKVIGSFTPDPHHILVNAKAPGEATFVAWDVNHVGHSYTISSDVDVSQLSTALRSEFPGDPISVASDGAKIVLTGNVGTMDDYKLATSIAKNYAAGVSNSLRIVPRHGKEVLLKVRFAEVDRSKLDQVGFNLLSEAKTIGLSTTGQYQSFVPSTLGGAQGVGGTGGSLANTSQVSVTNPLNLLLFSSTYDIGAALQALETRNVLQILAEPDLVAMSGKQATFLSGGEFPFPVIEGGTGTSVAVTIQFRPYGVRLSFTPTVLPDGTIHLHVFPSVSALDYTNEVQIDGYTIPALDTRRAETDVELRSGQTFVISGLIDHRLTDTFEKMPFIGDIPILGQFFKSKSVNASDVELLVIVTPTIVDPLHAPQMKPALPKLAKPFLDDKKFDKGLPGKAPHNSY
jgi:pilus assembly protein CpaC